KIGVGLATIRRDRFGFLSTCNEEPGLFTTEPISRRGSRPFLFLNVEGLGAESYLRVELISELGAPIAGFSGAAAAYVKESGLHVKVTWPRGSRLTFPAGQFRIRIHFEGAQAGKSRFFAAYLIDGNRLAVRKGAGE